MGCHTFLVKLCYSSNLWDTYLKSVSKTYCKMDGPKAHFALSCASIRYRNASLAPIPFPLPPPPSSSVLPPPPAKFDQSTNKKSANVANQPIRDMVNRQEENHHSQKLCTPREIQSIFERSMGIAGVHRQSLHPSEALHCYTTPY